MISKLSKMSWYWRLKGTGTIWEQKLISAENPGKYIWPAVKKQAKLVESRKLWYLNFHNFWLKNPLLEAILGTRLLPLQILRFLNLEKSEAVQQLVKQLVYKVNYTRYQDSIYL